MVRVPRILAIKLLELHNIQVPTRFPRSTMYLIKLFQVLLTIPNPYIITFGPTSTKYKCPSWDCLWMQLVHAQNYFRRLMEIFDSKMESEKEERTFSSGTKNHEKKKLRATRDNDISFLLWKSKVGRTVKCWREHLCTSTTPEQFLEGR